MHARLAAAHLQTVPLSDYDVDYSRQLNPPSCEDTSCYRCVEKKTGRELCAKVYQAGNIMSGGEIVAEFTTLRSARHVPNTVNVAALACGHPQKGGKDLVMIMELCGGGDLMTWMMDEECAVSEADAKILFREVLRTVHGLHETGVLHRNIQPENIVLFAKSPTKFRLAGFSLSHDLKGARDMAGSADYTAPEIWALRHNENRGHDDDGPALYGPAVDVWSIGITMLVALTATNAYDDSGITAERKEHYEKGEVMTYTTDLLKKAVSTKCFDFVTSILKAVDPAQRPTIPELLKHPWIAPPTPVAQAIPIAQAIPFASSVPVATAVQSPPPGFGPRATAWFSPAATTAIAPPPGFGDGAPPGFSIKAAVTVPPGFEGSQMTIMRPDTKEIIGISVPPGYVPGMQFMAEVAATESTIVAEADAVAWSGPPGFRP